MIGASEASSTLAASFKTSRNADGQTCEEPHEKSALSTRARRVRFTSTDYFHQEGQDTHETLPQIQRITTPIGSLHIPLLLSTRHVIGPLHIPLLTLHQACRRLRALVPISNSTRSMNNRSVQVQGRYSTRRHVRSNNLSRYTRRGSIGHNSIRRYLESLYLHSALKFHIAQVTLKLCQASTLYTPNTLDQATPVKASASCNQLQRLQSSSHICSEARIPGLFTIHATYLTALLDTTKRLRRLVYLVSHRGYCSNRKGIGYLFSETLTQYFLDLTIII